MSSLRTTMFAASLALTLSAHAVAGEEPHAAKGTAELQYRLVELPDLTPDGAQGTSVALSINDRGEVLGYVTRPADSPFDPDPTDIVVWRRAQIVAVLRSPDPALPELSAGIINNRSEVVGTIHTDVENEPQTARAFVWRRGQFTVLDLLPNSGSANWGMAINDRGEVVGSAQKILPSFVAPTTFRWFRGRFEELPTGETESAFPLDINNRGQVVGNSSADLGAPYRAFVWSRKGSLRFLDLLPGARSMFARAINDRGQVVGWAESPDPSQVRGFFWENGDVMDLGTLPGSVHSVPAAINVFGTVVGYTVHPDFRFTAMVWREGEMHDLNDLIADDDPRKSHVMLRQAFDVNNFGWIVAIGGGRGYVLVPVWKRRG
jgi:probable HAF family extracellular repeat protein